jgi:uncharacterized repeat protein (TIGR03803 family)
VKTSDFGCLLSLSIAVGVFTGCSGPQPPLAAPAQMPQSYASPRLTTSEHAVMSSRYKSLYSFPGTPGGAGPLANLIDVNNTLYGTASGGGSLNSGIIFEVSVSGKLRVLHNFKSGTDGATPQSQLIDVDGTLYGTTTSGGDSQCKGRPSAPGCGTVFAVSTSGKEHVLYRFKGGSDGSDPVAGLIALNSTLYGTTKSGATQCQSGSVCGGSVFKLSTSGSEHVLHSFKGYPSDGAAPFASLVAVNGTLYGTTNYGGSGSCSISGFDVGCGTVFKLSTSGKENVVYSFKGGTDGANPQAGLISMNGALYGTTLYGGASNSGTVFQVSTSGSERVIHSFGAASDGRWPEASLVALNGALYGTTAGGGAGCGTGCGTVFKMNTSNHEIVLYSFKGPPDGSSPSAGLTIANGALYGTTSVGGSSCGSIGCGTIFQIAP